MGTGPPLLGRSRHQPQPQPLQHRGYSTALGGGRGRARCQPRGVQIGGSTMEIPWAGWKPGVQTEKQTMEAWGRHY